MGDIIGPYLFDTIDAVQLDTTDVRNAYDRIIRSNKPQLISVQNHYMIIIAGLLDRLHESLLKTNAVSKQVKEFVKKNNTLAQQCAQHQQEISNLSIENQTLKTVRLGTQNYEKYKEQMAIVSSTIQKKEDQIMKIEMKIVKEKTTMKTENKVVQMKMIENHKCLEEKKMHLRKDIYTEKLKEDSMKKYEYIYSGLSEAQQKTAIELGWFNPSLPLSYRQEILALVARLHNDRDVGRFLFERGKIASPRYNASNAKKYTPTVKQTGMYWFPQTRLVLASLAADKYARDMSDVDLTSVSDKLIEDMTSESMQDCNCTILIAELPLENSKEEEKGKEKGKGKEEEKPKTMVSIEEWEETQFL